MDELFAASSQSGSGVIERLNSRSENQHVIFDH